MKTNPHSILSAPVTDCGNQTQNSSIRRKRFALALGGFLFTSLFALSAPPVKAQCQQWNFSGQWEIRQGSFLLSLALNQTGTVVTGTAVSTNSTSKLLMHGQVGGTAEGDSFLVTINWPNGGGGVYKGKMRPNGTLHGVTSDKNHPTTSRASWEALTTFKCADAAPAPAGTPITSSASGLKGSTGFVKPKPDKEPNAAADEWINQELSKRKKATEPTPKPRGFINGLQLATPTPSAEADESSSDDTQDQHKKNKKNKKKHHHHDGDDQNQGNE